MWVEVVEGMRGTVTSRAKAEYRRIWEVALKSPLGSAVTIMIDFWGEWVWWWRLGAVWGAKELEKSSSVSLHWRKGTRFCWERGC